MDFMVLRDTITGKALSVTLLRPGDSYIVGRDFDIPELIKPRSIGKTIRAWMKEIKKGCPTV